MDKFELLFIPSPGLSHLVATVEAAKLFLLRDARLSVAVLTMHLPADTSVAAYTAKIPASDRLAFLPLPPLAGWAPQSKTSIFELIDGQIGNVRDLINRRRRDRPDRRLAGLVLDMFCLNFIELCREFELPAYCFFTSGACSLGFFQYAVATKFDEGKELSVYKNSDAELPVPCFSLPVPAGVIPAIFVDGGPVADVFLNYFRKISETAGVLVNTFHEFESYAIDSILAGKLYPRVYPVGPILDLSGLEGDGHDDVRKWLDDQPEKSVVFLCFGTMGSLDENQVREIAVALENCGCQFLWSLRKKAAKGGPQALVEYDDLERVLPDGFLERTKGIGRVIGWAPQVAVLAHPAVGGFVSHCGWNSTLESVWFGVPVATFPLYAEQQLNAFYLGKELGMAEVITLDYKIDFRGEAPPEIVGAEEIEAALKRLMGGAVRPKVEEMKRKGRAALEEGGSSYKAQTLFIEDVIKNIS